VSHDGVDEQLRLAEREALEARAGYMLRNKIIENVLTVDPILQAIHSGSRATSAEEYVSTPDTGDFLLTSSRRLLPLINERDVLAMLQSSMAEDLSATIAELASTEQSLNALNQKNQDLAQTLFALIDQTQPPSVEEVDDPTVRTQIETLDTEVRESKRLWRLTKSIVANVVVGSGVNWAQDEALQELVLDDEDGIW